MWLMPWYTLAIHLPSNVMLFPYQKFARLPHFGISVDPAGGICKTDQMTPWVTLSAGNWSTQTSIWMQSCSPPWHTELQPSVIRRVSWENWNSTIGHSDKMVTMTNHSLYPPREVLTLVAFLPFVGPTFNCVSGVLSKHNIKTVDLPLRKANIFFWPIKDDLGLKTGYTASIVSMGRSTLYRLGVTLRTRSVITTGTSSFIIKRNQP